MTSLHQFHERGDGRSDTVAGGNHGAAEMPQKSHPSRTLSVILDSKVKMAS